MHPPESDPTRAVTMLLSQIRSGRVELRADLMALVYGELRRIAEACFRSQPAGHTLQPTALVHEAFVKLAGAGAAGAAGRAEFFAVAARAMRQVLVDHARTKHREKRGGFARRSPAGLVDALPADAAGEPGELLDLDRALEDLAERDARQAKVVELRYFGGLEMVEVAACLSISLSTAERDWRVARAWLSQRLAAD